MLCLVDNGPSVVVDINVGTNKLQNNKKFSQMLRSEVGQADHFLTIQPKMGSFEEDRVTMIVCVVDLGQIRSTKGDFKANKGLCLFLNGKVGSQVGACQNGSNFDQGKKMIHWVVRDRDYVIEKEIL